MPHHRPGRPEVCHLQRSVTSKVNLAGRPVGWGVTGAPRCPEKAHEGGTLRCGGGRMSAPSRRLLIPGAVSLLPCAPQALMPCPAHMLVFPVAVHQLGMPCCAEVTQATGHMGAEKGGGRGSGGGCGSTPGRTTEEGASSHQQTNTCIFWSRESRGGAARPHAATCYAAGWGGGCTQGGGQGERGTLWSPHSGRRHRLLCFDTCHPLAPTQAPHPPLLCTCSRLISLMITAFSSLNCSSSVRGCRK